MVFAGATLGFKVAFEFCNDGWTIFKTGLAEEIHGWVLS